MDVVDFHFIETETSFSTPALPLMLPEQERHLIDAHWQGVNVDGRFFNGAVLAGTSLTLDDNPALKICTSDYAHYLYSKAHTTATPCRIVYCAAIIVTSDDCMLVGEMASSTSSPGQLQLVGGNIEIASDGTISGRECCIREISEEVGSAFLEHVAALHPLCIKTGGKGDHIGIFYLLRLTMTAAEAKRAFGEHLAMLNAREKETELTKIHLIELTPEATQLFCASHTNQLVDYLSPLLTDHLQEVRGPNAF